SPAMMSSPVSETSPSLTWVSNNVAMRASMVSGRRRVTRPLGFWLAISSGGQGSGCGKPPPLAPIKDHWLVLRQFQLFCEVMSDEIPRHIFGRYLTAMLRALATVLAVLLLVAPAA